MSLDANYTWRTAQRRALPRATRRRWQKVAYGVAIGLGLLVYSGVIYLAAQLELPGSGGQVSSVVSIRLNDSERLRISESAQQEQVDELNLLQQSKPVEEDLSMEQLDVGSGDFSQAGLEEGFDLPDANLMDQFMAVENSSAALPESMQEAGNLPGLVDLAQLNQTVASPQQLRLAAEQANEDNTDYLSRLLAGEQGRANAQALAGYNTVEGLFAGGEGGFDPSKPILLPTDLLFDFGSDELRAQARESLLMLAVVMDRAPEAKFRIEGHTDTIGDELSNQALSLRRAQAVAGWLRSQLLVAESQLEVAGRGEGNPLVAPQGDAEAQALNRRVEIVVEGELGNFDPTQKGGVEGLAPLLD